MNRFRLIATVASLLIVARSSAQAPGGVPVTGGLWIKSNAGVTAPTGNVTTVNDFSGGGLNLTATNGGGATTIKKDSGLNGINFNPALTFVHTGQYLKNGTVAGAAVTAGSSDVFFVYRSTQNLPGSSPDGFGYTEMYTVPVFISSEQQNSPYDYSASFRSGLIGVKGTAFTLGLGANNANGTDHIDLESTTTTNDNAVRIGTVTRTLAAGSVHNGPLAIYNDHVLAVSNAVGDNQLLNQGSTSPIGIGIGNSVNNIGAQANMQYAGDIAEMAVYPSNLSATNRQKVWSYLALKYGITLDQTSNYDYLASDGTNVMWDATQATVGSTQYNNNIAGLGRDDLSGLNQKESKSINSGFQVTMGNNNTIVTQNENHPTNFTTDKSFEVWADDGGSLAFATNVQAMTNGGIYRMGRIWQVQENNTVGSVKVAILASDVSASGSTFYLITSSDNNITATDTYTPMILETINGLQMYTATHDYTDGEFFTFGVFKYAELTGTTWSSIGTSGGTGTQNCIGVSATFTNILSNPPNPRAAPNSTFNGTPAECLPMAPGDKIIMGWGTNASVATATINYASPISDPVFYMEAMDFRTWDFAGTTQTNSNPVVLAIGCTPINMNPLSGTVLTSTACANSGQVAVKLTGIYSQISITRNLRSGCNVTDGTNWNMSARWDYGDAPTSYGLASHNIPETPDLMLGSVVDYEGAYPTAPGTAADADGLDEDGVASITTIANSGVPSQTIPSYSITTSYTNNSASAADILCWIDWNNNGTFEASEGKTVNVAANTSGNITFTYTNQSFAATAGQNTTYARLRIANAGLTTSTPSTCVRTGEVEDYAIPFANAITYPPVAQNVVNASMNSSNGSTPLIPLLATDPQGAAITSYTVTTLPATGTLYYCNPSCAPVVANTTLITDPTKLQYDPVQGTTASTTITFNYTATSVNGTSNVAMVTVPIINNPPAALSMTTAAVQKNSTIAPLTSPISATDADGTVTNYTVNVPSSGTLKYCATGSLPCTAGNTIAAGTVLTPTQAATLQYTPAAAFAGLATFTFTATDNNANVSKNATVTIPITADTANVPLNLPPVTQSIYAAPMNASDGITALPSLIGTDPDGTVASFKILTIPVAASIGTLKYCPIPAAANCTPSTIAAANDVLTPAQAATLAFTPAATYAGGTVTFDYNATDNQSAVSNTSTVSIPVNNPAPTAYNITASLMDATTSVNAAVPSFYGTDDGSVAHFNITTAIPAAQGVLKVCLLASCTSATITTVLTTTNITPAQATTLVFTPSGTYTGDVVIPYTATDNLNLTGNTATLTIPVGKMNGTNVPPVAYNYNAGTINANSSTPLSLSAALSATDADGTIASYTVEALPPVTEGVINYCATPGAGCATSALPAFTTLTAAQAATLAFTPNAAYAGPVNFTYLATDNTGLRSNVAQVSLLTTNKLPVADAVTTAAVTSGGPAVTVPLYATDADGSVSYYVPANLPPATTGVLNYCTTGTLPTCTATPVVAGTPLTPAQAATVTFTPAAGTLPQSLVTFDYYAIDNTGASGNMSTASIPVVKTTAPLPPVAQNITTDPMNSSNGATAIPSLIATDPQGAPITAYTITTLPATGVLSYCNPTCAAVVANTTVITDPTKLQFDPAQGTTPSLTITFNYTATSVNGTSAAATYTIPVVNEAPIAQSMTTAPVAAGNPGAANVVPMLQAVDKDGTIATYTVSPPAAGGGLKYCLTPTVGCTPATAIGAATALTQAQVATLVFTPTGNTIGVSTFTFTVTDNNGNVSNVAEVNIPVTTLGQTPGNLPPVTQDVTVAPMLNTTGATYLPSLTGSDPDGTIANYKLTTVPTAAQGTLEYCVSVGSCATAVVGTAYTNPANFRFTPNPTNVGGAVIFNYTATDNSGSLSNTSTVTIPVTNPRPVVYNVISTPVAPGAVNAPVSSLLGTDNGSILNYTVTTIPAATVGVLKYCAAPAVGCTPASAVAVNTVLTPAQAATLAFTPAADPVGPAIFTYTALDNLSAASLNPASLIIPILKSTPGNVPPVAKDYTAATINSNTATPTTLATALTATDADGTIAQYTVRTVPPATMGSLTYCTTPLVGCTPTTSVAAGTALSIAQAATIAFTPNAAYSGPVNFTYTATDNSGALSNVANVIIPIKNLPPVAAVVNVAPIIAGGAATPVTLAATDPDGTVATYTVSNIPPATQGVLNYCTTGTLPGCTATPLVPGTPITPAQAATITFTPAAGTIPVVDVTFHYFVTDNTGATSNEAGVNIPVYTPAPLLPPVAQNVMSEPMNTVNGQTPLPALIATDPQGSPITTYTITSAITSGLLYYCNPICTPLTNGATFTDPTKLSFDPDAQPGVLSGALVAGTFTYTATSANGTSNIATVTIPVFNNAPVAQSMTTAAVLSGPAPVTVSIAPLQAADADGFINAATGYKITVIPTQGTLKYCTTGNLPCTGVLTTIAAGNTLTPAQAATLQYTPPVTATNTPVSFNFTATDNNGNVSNTALVTIPLTIAATNTPPYNLPPVTQDITLAPMRNTDPQEPVPALAGIDPDGEVVKYTVTVLPTRGTLYYCNPICATVVANTTVITDPTKLQYIPDATYAGAALPFAGYSTTFSYTATDNLGLVSNTSIVTIPVTNPAPNAMNITTNPVSSNATSPVAISGPMASDNGTITNYTINAIPVAATQGTLYYCFTPSAGCTPTQPVGVGTTLTPAQAATLAFTPVSFFTGTITIPYKATDNNGAISNLANLSIPVQKPAVGAGLPPVANDTVTVPINANTATPTAIPYAMLATDADGIIAYYTVRVLPPASEGTLSYCVGGLLPGCTLTPVVVGVGIPVPQGLSLSFTPASTYTGPVNFTYTANDNDGNISNVGNVMIPVRNLAPVANGGTSNPVTSGGPAVTVTIAATDPDGTIANYIVSTLPPASEGVLSYCTTGTLPGCTLTPVVITTPLTPAQATTLTFTPASGVIPVSQITFDYYATDNTGTPSNQNNVSIPVYTPAAVLPPIAQNYTTDPMNSSNGLTPIAPLLASDPQGSAITSYTVTALPATGVLSYCNPTCTAVVANTTVITDPTKLQYDPVQGTTPSTSVTFTYTATSTNGGSNTATVTIPIFNNAPIATSMTTATVKTGILTPVPLPALQAADEDGGIAPANGFKITSLPTNGTLNYCTTGTYPCTGTVTPISVVNTTLTPAQAATLTFQPTVAFVGTSIFTFTATDANGNVSNTAEVNIPVAVNGILLTNLPPVTQDMTLAPILASAASSAIPKLIGNDPDGTVTTFTITTIPVAGTVGVLKYCASPAAANCSPTLTAAASSALSPAQAATLVFQPIANYAGGTVTFNYTATDNSSAVSNTSTVTIPVINPAPVVYNIYSPQIAPGTTNGVVSGLVGTDNSSIQNYTITAIPVAATVGTLKYCSTGGTLPSCANAVVAVGTILTPAQAATLVFTPVAGYTGTVAIPYTAKDNASLTSSNTAQLYIPVQKPVPGNLPPVAKDYVAAQVSSNAATPVIYPTALSATDADATGTIASYTVQSLPAASQGTLTYCTAGGTCVGAGTPVAIGTALTPAQAATIAFQPNAGFSGPVNFYYYATDNRSAVSNVALVTIPVVNIAPVTQSVTTPATATVTPITLVAADPDGGTITAYVINTIPVAGEGTLSYCSNGTSPCTGTTTLLAGGEILTPAQAATLAYTRAGSSLTIVTFDYSAIDNTNAVSNMSTVSLPKSTPNPLPVTLLDYSADAKSCDVLVSWKTGAEANINSYTIEQGFEGAALYTEVAHIAPKGSNSSYAYTISNVEAGKSMYRLRIDETSGDVTYSRTAMVVSHCNESGAITLTPNPATTAATLSLNAPQGSYTVRIVNAQGQLITTRTVTTGAQQSIVQLENLDSYARGVYMVIVTNAQGAQVFISRLLLQ